MAMLSFLGWFLFSCFTGIGLIVRSSPGVSEHFLSSFIRYPSAACGLALICLIVGDSAPGAAVRSHLRVPHAARADEGGGVRAQEDGNRTARLQAAGNRPPDGLRSGVCASGRLPPCLPIILEPVTLTPF